jgi:beta-lactamase superfamily II metal-dependent hydrolase
VPEVHFLNVNDGDCSIIRHFSGRVTVIDVNNAHFLEKEASASWLLREAVRLSKAKVAGNYQQKKSPDNPIAYMNKLGISNVFRFIVTHPDMDHIDGIRDFFAAFQPDNLWDTANTKEFDEDAFDYGKYNKDDWEFYKYLRDTSPSANPKRLVYYSGNSNDFYNKDGLAILAPTPELIREANEKEDWNDSSYVILYQTCDMKILFCGDSEDGTWEHILAKWRHLVADVDIMIAPHHGRHSGRSYDFLGVTRPRLTLFGCARSEHLGYAAWNSRGLEVITNNQAGYIVLSVTASSMGNPSAIDVYVKNETFAEDFTSDRAYSTHYSSDHDGWYLGTLKGPA